MKRIIDRAHQIASHALLRPRLDIPNRYSVSSNENSFFLRLLGSVPWNKSPGQSSVFIFDISYMNYNLFPFLSQKIFSTKTIEEKKKERKKEGEKIVWKQRVVVFISISRYRTVNYDKRDRDLHTRARQVTRAVDLDDSSIIPPDTNGVDVPEIVGILRPNSHHEMNPLLPFALHQPSLPFPCLVSSETNEREIAIARETG